MQRDDLLQNEDLLQNPGYDPDNLLDVLLEKFQLKSDSALARLLGVAPPAISIIRSRKKAVGAVLLVKMNELCDISIRDLRVLMGDRRERFSDRRSRYGDGATNVRSATLGTRRSGPPNSARAGAGQEAFPAMHGG